MQTLNCYFVSVLRLTNFELVRLSKTVNHLGMKIKYTLLVILMVASVISCRVAADSEVI